MTRKEAIEKLELMRQKVDEETYRALILAIKALEQQPCDDAVSREAVIEILENYGCTNREGLIFKDIRALPSVTHNSGKWIEHLEIETSAPKYLMFYECSECGDKPCFCKSDIHKKRFCSNCGAKMVEPQESEDN